MVRHFIEEFAHEKEEQTVLLHLIVSAFIDDTTVRKDRDLMSDFRLKGIETPSRKILSIKEIYNNLSSKAMKQ